MNRAISRRTGRQPRQSLDSRAPVEAGGVGFVPFENLVGKAEILFFSFDDRSRWWEVWNWPTAIRYRRLAQPIG